MTDKTYFARILTTAQVDTVIELLEDAAKATFDRIGDRETCEIHAPDGDMVFAALKMREGIYLCRMHKEVFDEETAQGGVPK